MFAHVVWYRYRDCEWRFIGADNATVQRNADAQKPGDILLDDTYQNTRVEVDDGERYTNNVCVVRP